MYGLIGGISVLIMIISVVQNNLTSNSISDIAKNLAFGCVASTLVALLIEIGNVKEKNEKEMYYFSMEFLIGRLLTNNLMNLGIYDIVKDGLADLGIDINAIEEMEADAGLGNGGLGRLAACFLDSLASLNLAGHGNCIRYQYGLFKQKIENNEQVEVPDVWLQYGNVWEVRKPKHACDVKFGGHVDMWYDENGKTVVNHIPNFVVRAVPYDVPVVGYDTRITNTLRLWNAEIAPDFVTSDKLSKYVAEVDEITQNVYPDDSTEHGKLLRLKQEYFFVCAGINQIIRRHLRNYPNLDNLHEKIAIQLNDTHPVLCVPELMRVLLDDFKYDWDQAWYIVKNTIAYTNHTVMAEALEKWPRHYLDTVVPQLMPIIEKLDEKIKAKYPQENVAIIDKNNLVHMAHMDIHYGFSINGVAALHTEILKTSELKAFYDIYPEKFNNKTNGITFRRWLMHCNHPLTDYITSLIGDEFKTNATALENLLKYKDDDAVLNKLLEIKTEAKKTCKEFILSNTGVEIDENSIYDIQIKRLHEYKRQQLNALYIISKYLEIKGGKKPSQPVTFIFGAKAAPAYVIAKDIIHLLLTLQDLIKDDPEVAPHMKLVMVQNYNVSAAEKLFPACDISEQISLASKEASGTGNMKFMLNGAVTLGTMDGANVEISELVGEDNIYIFGESSEKVIEHYEKADYCSRDIYENDKRIKECVDFIVSEKMLALGHKENLERLHHELVSKDWFMTLLDFNDYVEKKDQALADYADRKTWAKKMLVNIAKAGFFSSDRTIEQYNNDIWHLTPAK